MLFFVEFLIVEKGQVSGNRRQNNESMLNMGKWVIILSKGVQNAIVSLLALLVIIFGVIAFQLIKISDGIADVRHNIFILDNTIRSKHF